MAAAPITTALVVIAARRAPERADDKGAETGTPRWRRSSLAKEIRAGGWLSAPPDEVAHLGPGRDAQLPQDVRDVNGGGLR